MSDTLSFKIDGKAVSAKPGQTILEAADAAGVWIPRLCHLKGLIPHGSCRICLVKVNGRPQAACTMPAAAGMEVENEVAEVQEARKATLEMLFVEGNHFCPSCEKSGDCELQALAYRFGIANPRYPYFFPKRTFDASHPDIFVDLNRCILCARCVRASIQQDGKHVFDFTGRGSHKKLAVDSTGGLGASQLVAADQGAKSCPVGAIVRKGTAFHAPYGTRTYDAKPIGS